jgi:hypothetical protein
MIGPEDVTARERRLEELTRGLAKEVALWREGNDPLLYLERKSYLHAIQDALAGVEAARVVMAKAAQRMRKDGGGEAEGEAKETEPPDDGMSESA